LNKKNEKIERIKKRVGELPFEIKLETSEQYLIVYFFDQPNLFDLLEDEEDFVVQGINELRESLNQ